MIQYDMTKGLGVAKVTGRRDEANIDEYDMQRESIQRPATRNSQRGRNQETQLIRRDLCDATPSFFNGGTESKQLKATAAILDSEESGSEKMDKNEKATKYNTVEQVNQVVGQRPNFNMGTPVKVQKADEAMTSSPEGLGRKHEGPGPRGLARDQKLKAEHFSSVDEAKYNN